MLELWGVIGTWVASIGTVAAVITSLWLASHQNSIKLKVSAGERIMIRPGSSATPQFCAIYVANIGMRPARITNISWEVGKRKGKKYLMQTFGFPGYDDVPKNLQEGEQANFMIPFNFNGDETDWIKAFPKYVVGNDDPKLLKTLTLKIHTSVGATYSARAEEGLINSLIESYEVNRTNQQT